MDALSDPRDESKWSADDLITMGFLNTPELVALLQDTPKLGELDPGEYDAIMAAGGQAPMFSFRGSQPVHDAVRRFYEAEKPVCVYCHGTAALVDLETAMAGAEKVFLLCSAAQYELAWHRNAIDAAARAGSSTWSAARSSALTRPYRPGSSAATA